MSKILVIDDEEIILSLAERILKRDNHEVLLAENGNSGLELFQLNNESIDLVIVDMTMDDINGFELLSEIRKLNTEIPGIISSGNCYDEDDIPSEINNNIYFLQKPYRAQQLSALINSILIPA